jgi:hypothetical protein
MSGIRYLIAVLFLFAGLEGKLHASASQALPANSSKSPTDIITNLNSKTSVDKMTKTAPDRVQGILEERVIDTACRFLSQPALAPLRRTASLRSIEDGFRTSGSSPPV